MILGLLAWIVSNGMPTFWPQRAVQITTLDGRTFLGEVTREEVYRLDEQSLQTLPEATAAAAREWKLAHDGQLSRRLVRTGNYELFQTHFEWLGGHEIASETGPDWAVVVEHTVGALLRDAKHIRALPPVCRTVLPMPTTRRPHSRKRNNC